MKRGIETVEMSLDELLIEVFHNNFDNFRKHLNNSNIKTLNLRYKVAGENLRLLGEALNGTAVTKVNLSGNLIDPISAKELGEALKDTAVNDVDLSWNQLGPIGASNFGETLKGTAVTHVDLSFNLIHPIEAKGLGETLKRTAVSQVNLQGNGLGPIGAKDFGKALIATSVTHVDLSWNEIGAIGAKDFVENIKGTTLTSVNFSYNAIDHLCTEIISAIPETNLTEIILDGNKVSLAHQQQLHRALAANRLRLNLEAYATAQAILEANEKACNINPACSILPTEIIGLLLQQFPIVRAEGPSNRHTLINQFINMASKNVSKH